MTRLARWCFTHRRIVLAAWLLLLVVALGGARAGGSAFNSDLSLPGTDSQAAVGLLTQIASAAANMKRPACAVNTSAYDQDNDGNRCAVVSLANVPRNPPIPNEIACEAPHNPIRVPSRLRLPAPTRFIIAPIAAIAKTPSSRRALRVGRRGFCLRIRSL